MQTDFSSSLNSKPFLVGQVFDTSLKQVDSAAAEETIPFGTPVQLGTASDTALIKVKKLTTGGTFWGIALRSNIQPVGGVLATQVTDPVMVNVTTSLDSHPTGAMLAVMRFGRVVISIPTGSTVTDGSIGSLVYYTLATGAITTQVPTAVAVANSVVLGSLLTPATAGKLAAIQVNKLI